MTKQKRVFTRAVALFLLVCLCVSMVACGKNRNETPLEEGGKENATYTVCVKSQAGQPLSGINVMIYTDESLSDLVWADKTDANGEVTFSDVTSEGYVAVLSGVPEGYQTEKCYPLTGSITEIVLSAVLNPVEDLTTVTYGLGDVMNDFSVTAPDGTEYTLSKLLEEKSAVVLNFWYLECGPCKSEFPYLQQAYEKYGDKIEVLAMNPVDDDAEEVAAFQRENNYTFPMMLCDKDWAEAMQLTGYPTTVVIDRYGVITLIHRGAVTDVETFEDMFAFFSAEEYEQTIVKDIEELPDSNVEEGTEAAPIEMGVMQSFTVTVDAGKTLYLNIYKVTTQYMQVNSSDAFVIYKGTTYKPSGGRVGLTISSDDTYAPVLVGIGNSGKETQTFSVTMSALPGTHDNPYPLDLGEFKVSVAAGNDKGVFHLYHATEDGVLTVECLGATAGVAYDFVLYNLTSYQYRNYSSEGRINEKGNPVVSVSVHKGDRVEFSAAPMPDDYGNYPSAKFTFFLAMSDGSDLPAEEEKLTYAVTLTDESRKPVAGAQVNLVVDGETVSLMTNDSGVASVKLPAGDYTAFVRVPAGYEARNTVFKLTAAIPTISVKLDTVVTEMAEYTVRVADKSGKPIANALVSIGDASVYTNAAGEASVTLVKGDYDVSVSADGYAFASAKLTNGATSVTVTLEKGSQTGINYTVKVVDYFGQPMTGVVVNIQKNGVAAGVQEVDASGTAVFRLAPGDYTFTLNGYYFDAAKAVLSAQAPSVTITAVTKLGSEYRTQQGYDLYFVNEGATYSTLNTTKVDGEDIVDNFFVFTPTRSGTYRFTTSDPKAVISYWATSNFIFQNTPEGYQNNSFTLNIKDDQISNDVGYVVGVTGASDCILLITRTGDAQKTIEDYPWSTDWQTGATPSSAFTATGSGTLTYFDLQADSSRYTLVYNSRDKVYHLGSATGPMIMVRLDLSAPYISFQDILEAAAVRKYFFNADGSFQKKEDYTEYMIACVKYRDVTYGTYPLTEDLKYILENFGEYAGWYDVNSGIYLFGDTQVNPDLAWMFACCYLN